MRTKEMNRLRQSEPLLKKRNEETQKLAQELAACLKNTEQAVLQAGRLIKRLVDRTWDGDIVRAHAALIQHKPMDIRTFNRLLDVGRGALLPQMVYLDAPYVRYVAAMPVEEQRKLVLEKATFPCITGVNGSAIMENTTIEALNTDAACKRIFVKSGSHLFRLRTEVEQREHNRVQYAALAKAANRKNSWYVPSGDCVKLLAPRTVKRETLAKLLHSIVLGTGASSVTQDEIDLCALLNQRLGR